MHPQIASQALEVTSKRWHRYNVSMTHTAKVRTVLAIQPGCVTKRDEKLTAIGVLASVSHGQHAWRVLQLEVFIRELSAVDAFAACAVALVKIATCAYMVCSIVLLEA